MAVPHLTAMRRSVWSAIDNWDPFDGFFRLKYRGEGKGAMVPADLVPPLAKIPAILIEPESGNTPWTANQLQSISYALSVVVWTPGYSPLLGEWIWEQFSRMLYQAAPSGTTQSYVEAQSNNHSVVQPASTAILDADGNPYMRSWSWSLTLEKQWNPNSETEVLERVEAE